MALSKRRPCVVLCDGACCVCVVVWFGICWALYDRIMNASKTKVDRHKNNDVINRH